MSRLMLFALAPAALATAAVAQTPDPHAGHQMPAQAAPPPAAADPHAGHAMSPPPAAGPHAGHLAPEPADPHAGHAATGADLTVGGAPPPAVPAENLADAVWGRPAMDRARGVLRAEHGGAPHAKVMLDRLELSPRSGADGFAWEGAIRYGGDVNRLMLKSEGGGEAGETPEEAEVQVLWSHAIGPYFDVQAGVRQDFRPRPRRTYATVGVEGLAPYWFEVEGAVFLSDEGEVSARLEGSYDLRLTQRLILEPSVEANLAANDVPELGIGAGLTDLELGLRLRYEVRREIAPYVGVEYERSFGNTADFARVAGEDVEDTRLVVGLRAWF